MATRHDMIGIKQIIRVEWMQKTVNLILAGLPPEAIRQELHGYLSERMGSGSQHTRSAQTRAFAVSNLMNMWVVPIPELDSFRDTALSLIQQNPSYNLPVQWAMISAVYPFWFNVAQQTGRLLALQDQLTHSQIVNRLKEQYGDKQTVSRNVRYVIRSLVAWGVLVDSESKGCYEKSIPINITDPDLAILLLESALHAIPAGKKALPVLLNNPALFPFKLPVISGDFIQNRSTRIYVIRYGLDEDMLELETN